MSVCMFNDGKIEPLDPPKELLDDDGSEPKTPLEAAIDRATGYAETKKAKSETKKADSETKKAKPETKKADSETKKAGPETDKPETATKKRDWVEEAYKCFIKDAGDIDPTDPVKAIEAYFRKNATDELKARCKAEGKDAKGCWRFLESVARKALGGRNGHIDPGVVYAIAMHWFEDVPVDWDKTPERSSTVKSKAKAEKKAKPKKPAETPSEKRKEEERRAKAAKPKAKKPKRQQGFFFEMLEMHTGQPEKDGLSSPKASAGAPGEENAVVPSTQPASTSNESEVKE